MPDDVSPKNLERLRRLREDHEQLFELRQPITAALMTALTQPIDVLEARAPEFAPEERVLGIDAIAEAMVRKAAKGDSAAFAQIVDRVEGKVGLRKGDEDADVAKQRDIVAATIEATVETMTRLRTNRQDTQPAMIEAQPVVVSPDPVPLESPQSETQDRSSR